MTAIAPPTDLLLRRLESAQNDCMDEGQAAAAILLQDARIEIIRLRQVAALRSASARSEVGEAVAWRYKDRIEDEFMYAEAAPEGEWDEVQPLYAAPVLPSAVRSGDVLTPAEAWHELVEKDDRTSPEEYPDMCLISESELRDFMQRAKSTSVLDPADEVYYEGYEQARSDAVAQASTEPKPMTADERWCAANGISYDDPTMQRAQSVRTWDMTLSERIMQLEAAGAQRLSIPAILGLITFVRDGEGLELPSADREARK